VSGINVCHIAVIDEALLAFFGHLRPRLDRPVDPHKRKWGGSTCFARASSVFQDYAPIPAQKRLLAIATGDQRWANLRSLLTAMPEEKGRILAAILKREFEFEAMPA